MNRFDGTSARQLDLIDFEPGSNDLAGNDDQPIAGPNRRETPRPSMRLLRKDVYAELTRRRRRAQIAARHELDKALSRQ